MYRVSKDHLIYAMSKENSPVASVPAGATVVFETCDCFENQITSVNTPFNELDWDRINPATGPVYIDGAEVGDILEVKIENISIADRGVMVTGPDLGVMGDRLTENVIRILPVTDNYVQFSETVRVPLTPMIGVIGTAPAVKAVSCGTPDAHGGNMDTTKIKAGSTLYLPVHTPGGLLALGDLHAAMGDGEVAVCGVEIAGEVTVTINVLKDKNWIVPMVKTEEALYTIASALTLDEAAKDATSNMVHLLEQQAGMNKHDAIALLSIAGNLQISQIVDPLKTARFELSQSILSQLGVNI